MVMTNSYDHPDRPPGRDDRTKAVFANYDRSRREYMDRKMRDRFKAFYNAYRSFSEIQDDGSTSNLSVPLIKAHVDSFYARLVGMRPVVDIQPREPGDVARAAKQRLLIEYQWDRMRMLLHAAELAKSALIYGIGWGKCTWRTEVRRRLVVGSLEAPEEVTGINLGPFQGLLEGFFQDYLGGVDRRMEDVTVWDDPWYENIPPDQVFPAPDGHSIDSCRYVIHRTQMSLDEFEALVKGGKIDPVRGAVGRLKKALEKGSLIEHGDSVSLMEDAADKHGGTGHSALPEDPTKREFTLLEHWTDERVRWAVAMDPGIGLLRDEPHALGMKPFVRFTPSPLPNELAGGALTEDLYSIWLEMNALKNARMDNVFRQVHPQIMIPFGVPMNPSHLRFKAGGRFFYDPARPPAFFEYPNAGNITSYREMADLRQMAEEIGGTRTFRGLEGEGDTTATEANLLAQASGTKFGAMLQQMNEQPFKRLGRILVRLNELNVQEPRYARVLGQDMPVEIAPADLASQGGAELDVTIDVATKDPDTRIVKLRRTTEAASALAQAMQADPSLTPLAQEMFVRMAEYHEIPNARQLVEQGRQMMAQQQQQMMAMGQQVGNFQGQQNTLTDGSQMAADQNNASGLPS